MTKLVLLLPLLLFLACSRAPVREGPQAPITGKSPVEVPSPRSSSPVDSLKAGDLPKVGLLIGPGGLKTYSVLGVLREFEKRKIPVHSVVGLEWGSLVAALYSHRGSTNDLEWQLFKLKSDNMPDTGVLGGKASPVSIKKLQSFFDLTLADKSIEEATVRFACPAMTLGSGKLAWFDRGRIQDLVKKCVPFPPLFEPMGSWVAGAFEIEEGAKRLREMGAQIVVFIDPLAKGTVLKDNRYVESDIQQTLWFTGLRRFVGAKSVDWYVGVHGRNYDIGDFNGLRSYIVFGQEAGERAAQMIADKYGF